MQAEFVPVLRDWCRLAPVPSPSALRFGPADWCALEVVAKREGVAGLVNRALDFDPAGTLAPDRVRSSLRRTALAQGALHAREEAVLGEVLDVLHAAGVRPVLLRGLGLIEAIYRDGSLRPQVDHDLLVSPGDVGPAGDALRSVGFRLSPGSSGPYLRDASVIDLHTDPIGSGRVPSRSGALRIDLRDASVLRTIRATVAGRRLVREVRPQQSYLSSSDPRVHFGLGQADRIERLDVRWPDGTSSTWRDVPLNRVLSLTPRSPEVPW